MNNELTLKLMAVLEKTHYPYLPVLDKVLIKLGLIRFSTAKLMMLRERNLHDPNLVIFDLSPLKEALNPWEVWGKRLIAELDLKTEKEISNLEKDKLEKHWSEMPQNQFDSVRAVAAYSLK